jgi:hypothetical protein
MAEFYRSLQYADPEMPGRNVRQFTEAFSQWSPKTAEAIRDPDRRFQFFKSIEPPQFEALLKLVNDTSRGRDEFIDESNHTIGGLPDMIHTSRLEYTNDNGARIVKYRPPHVGDRHELMVDVLHGAQMQETPENMATVLGFGINAVHPFTDGNKRTARIMHSVISGGFDGSAEVDTVLPVLTLEEAAGARGADLLYFSPRFLSRDIQKAQEKEWHDAGLDSYDVILPSCDTLGGFEVPKAVLPHIYDPAFNDLLAGFVQDKPDLSADLRKKAIITPPRNIRGLVSVRLHSLMETFGEIYMHDMLTQAGHAKREFVSKMTEMLSTDHGYLMNVKSQLADRYSMAITRGA